jgi:UDP-3-O-[3-hydroxymyristoyl] glucosamine N-acyltransferase
VTPAELLRREDLLESGSVMPTNDAIGPRYLKMRSVLLSDLARRYGLELVGRDRGIRTLNYVHCPQQIREEVLTYAVTASYVHECVERGLAACLVPHKLRPTDSTDATTFLVTERDAEETFYGVFADLVGADAFEHLPSRRGAGVDVASTAVVHEGVTLGDGCRIMDHAVILPNSNLGRNVVIKPGAVVGGDGFEVKQFNGRRGVVPHVGGVWLEDDVEVGSCTCVDRGLFGEFTFVGAETKIDNLVHVAHRVSIGRGCYVIACSELSGSVVLGEGVWVGPNSSVNPGLALGDYSYVGTASMVTRSVPAHGLAYGVPARVNGWMCRCRTRLVFTDGRATCSRCEETYHLQGEVVTRLGSGGSPIPAGGGWPTGVG